MKSDTDSYPTVLSKYKGDRVRMRVQKKRPAIGCLQGQRCTSSMSLLLLLLSCIPSASFSPNFECHSSCASHRLQSTRRTRQDRSSLLLNSTPNAEPSDSFQSTLLEEPHSWKSQWGVERHSSHSFPFPTTVSDLTDQIVTIGLAAVTGVQEPQMNPNSVQNALLGDRVTGRRPVRDEARDAGRIGIEIDGPVDILLVALIVAAKTSQRHTIPVTLYFDSLDATLQARRMLLRLCEQQTQRLYRNISIQVLTNVHLPLRRQTYGQATKVGAVNISKGIVFVVQPTRNFMSNLQRLAAQATVEGIPLILLSPRMTREITSPWDQSGYQQASAYGGDEPPTGPSPWLMRDFWPPVYSWIFSENVGYSHSILHEKQSWDVFECHREGRAYKECDYLASTVNCAGRPTQDLLRKIREEFASE